MVAAKKVSPKKVNSPEAKAKPTAVAVKEEAAPPAVLDSLMDDDQIDSRDILLPRVLVMQGLSKFVAEDKARMGEFRDSLDAKLLGSKDTAMEFIPFYSNKTWVVFKLEKGKQVYVATIPMTPHNMNLEREETIDGVEFKRYMCINYFVLLPSEIAAGEAFPYSISFRSTSYKAGRKLETQKAKYRAIKKPISWKTMNLTTALQENDKGKFYVLDVAPNRLTTNDELAEVKKWYDIVKTANVKIDESDASDLGASAGDESEEPIDVNAADAQY